MCLCPFIVIKIRSIRNTWQCTINLHTQYYIFFFLKVEINDWNNEKMRKTCLSNFRFWSKIDLRYNGTICWWSNPNCIEWPIWICEMIVKHFIRWVNHRKLLNVLFQVTRKHSNFYNQLDAQSWNNRMMVL